MFITLPKVFASMGLGTGDRNPVFFVLVLLAALTSAVSLMETSVSTIMDELHWGRKGMLRIDGSGYDRSWNCFFYGIWTSGFHAVSLE